jgi:hypothetical protein
MTPDLALILLVTVEPTDRALAGWHVSIANFPGEATRRFYGNTHDEHVWRDYTDFLAAEAYRE